MPRLYLDEDALSHRLFRALSAHFDVLTAESAGRRRQPDVAHLEFATAEGRTLITFNQRDFARIHGEWAHAGRTHAGIVCITDRRANVEVIARKLRGLLESRTEHEMRDVILYVNGDPHQELNNPQSEEPQ